MTENSDHFACIRPPAGFDPSDLPLPLPRRKKWTICSLALDVSGQCNQRCTYCAESATLPKRKPMTEDVLDRALNYFYDHLAPGATPAIRFGSGEPLLAPHILEQAAVRSKKLSEKYSYAPPQYFLTTNGTLLDKKNLRLLSSSEWHVKVSLDGPPDVHDRCRLDACGRGTFQKAVDAVCKLFDGIGERLSITAVLSPGTDPAEVFEFCESLHAGQIELLPVAEKPGCSTFTDKDLRRYRSFVAGYARDLIHGRTRATLSRFSNMIPRAMGFGLQRYRCGAGRALYAAGPDGSLYPCFRMIGVDAFCVGSVFLGIDDRSLWGFRNAAGCSFLKRKACAACWACSLCNGPCFALVGLMNLQPGTDSIQCAYTRMDAAEVIQMVSALRKQDPQRLLGYLAGNPFEAP